MEKENIILGWRKKTLGKEKIVTKTTFSNEKKWQTGESRHLTMQRKEKEKLRDRQHHVRIRRAVILQANPQQKHQQEQMQIMGM